MWLAFYNPDASGDVLMLTSGQADEDKVHVTSKDDVTIIREGEQGDIIACNIFNASKHLSVEGQGNIPLTEDLVSQLNALLEAQGCALTLTSNADPKFVVGYVESCEPHEDSDHLSITHTRVGEETLQIVCGASNIRQGLHVLVARVGAVMPSGMIIWPGELRGVASEGMICSTRELNLTQINDEPGIWELDASLEPGTPLEEVVAHYQS